MAETAFSGVFQLDNCFWGYRYTVTYNGKKKDVKKQKDEIGRPFKTEKAAFRARESAMLRDRMSRIKKQVAKRMAFAEVYQAYSRNYLDVDTYNKLCVMKEARISMPKLKNDEDTDIVAYEQEQVKALDEYFAGTNAETAYLLGCYCGLRINECYGLKWENVDLERGSGRRENIIIGTCKSPLKWQDTDRKLHEVPQPHHKSRNGDRLQIPPFTTHMRYIELVAVGGVRHSNGLPNGSGRKRKFVIVPIGR